MHTPYKIPVSVKGIVIDKGKVWLRKNEHNEWELPGGKLDPGEQPEQTVVRELYEELGFEVIPEELVSAFILNLNRTHDEVDGVLVLVYSCRLVKKSGTFETNGEAGISEFKALDKDSLRTLNIDSHYLDILL